MMFLCGFLLLIFNFGVHVVCAKLCFCPIHEDVAIYKQKGTIPRNIVTSIDRYNCFEGTLNDGWLKLTQYEDMYIKGNDIEEKDCDHMTGHPHHAKRFILDGQSYWSEWGNFSVCSQSCGTQGIQLRQRTCVQPSGNTSCLIGNKTESRNCTGKPCPDHEIYQPWTNWSTCNECFSLRTRSCMVNETSLCTKPEFQKRDCQTETCPKKYNWSLWTPWTECSVSCDGQGTHVRYRSCLDGDLTVNNTACGDGKYYDINVCNVNCPIIKHWTAWGAWDSCNCPNTTQSCCETGVRFRYRNCTGDLGNCTGEDFSYKSCKVFCQGEYEWSEWDKWVCSVTCENGTKLRTRHCLGVDGHTADEKCNGTSIDHGTCNEGDCVAVDGEWSTWDGWGTCDMTCGNGSQNRHRQCDNPPPNTRGQNCTGDSVDMRPCNETNPCPVNGGYSEWTDWSSCTKTCESGSWFHSRTCDNPTPAYGGDLCDVGPPIEIDLCNTEPCPIDGGWSGWYDWSTCSVSCTDGTRNRARNCTSPSPQYLGQNCTGNDTMSEPCNEGVCPIPGGWGEWGSWSGCACENSLQTRLRSCDSPSPVAGGAPCVGQKTESNSCTPGSTCPVQGMWASWEAWDGCNVTCGNGVDRRIRTCTHPRPANGGHYCDGDYEELVTCQELPCPVNGNWSAWSAWTDCDVTCASGHRSQNRKCDSPAPAYGGTNCSGMSINTENCTLSSCPVDGDWSIWSTWGDCDVTCGNGTASRNRTCDNPEPQYGGNTCQGQGLEHMTCVQTPCPVNGGFSIWSQWSDCSVTCGDGNRNRGRDCTNPLPAFGGKNCTGPPLETEVCNLEGCMVNGSWSTWSPWGECTTTCGAGERTHYRACDHPKPQFGGQYCTGTYLFVDSCPTPECPVDGGWSDWGAWPTCSVSCGNGTRTKTRSCTNPAPMYLGQHCPGNNTNTEDCNTFPCPIDGGWTSWEAWSSCDVTCGNGNLHRTRTCTQPVPMYNGTVCPGNSADTMACNMGPCPIDGQWSSWFPWTVCEGGCTDGHRERQRVCANPPPSNRGQYCVGDVRQNETCFPTGCHSGDASVSTDMPKTTAFGTNNPVSTVSSATVDPVTSAPVSTVSSATVAPVTSAHVSTASSATVAPVTSAPVSTVSSATVAPVTSAHVSTVSSATVVPVTSAPVSAVTNATVVPVTNQPVTTVTTVTTKPAADTSTPAPTFSAIASGVPTGASNTGSIAATTTEQPIDCFVCDGPPQICATFYKKQTCPHPYCINELQNNIDGSKTLERRCGTHEECFRDWWRGSSDNDKCTGYDDTQTVNNAIHCVFCCDKNLCNEPTVPLKDDLYKPT